MAGSDLHQGIDSTLNIVWNELKYKCQVIKEYGDIPPVYCLISQLNQVFMNMLVNAGHAIEKKGTITIRTQRAGDDKVCIEFSDTGNGIDPENLRRIFEPFFTTKPIGKAPASGCRSPTISSSGIKAKLPSTAFPDKAPPSASRCPSTRPPAPHRRIHNDRGERRAHPAPRR